MRTIENNRLTSDELLSNGGLMGTVVGDGNGAGRMFLAARGPYDLNKVQGWGWGEVKGVMWGCCGRG